LFSKDKFISNSSLSVLFVADLFHPVHDLAVQRLLNRYVRHRCGWRGTVPVLLAGWKAHHITGAGFLRLARPRVAPNHNRS
jgi:hypothetical protein